MANHLKHCAQVSYKSLKTWWRQCNWDNLWKDGRIDTGMVCWTDRLTDATQLQKLKPAGWNEQQIREYVPLHWQNSHFNTTWHLKYLSSKWYLVLYEICDVTQTQLTWTVFAFLDNLKCRKTLIVFKLWDLKGCDPYVYSI